MAAIPFPRLAAPPPLWREALVGLEPAALLRSPVFRGEGVADGRGQPVLLVPGFLAGDGSLGLMTQWLRRTGHHTRRAGIRLNVNCSAKAVDALEQRLEELVERQGRPAAIIGQSRGGTFAKALAHRRPDLVSGIVTLGSPHLAPLRVHPLVAAQVIAVGAVGTLGVPGLFRRSCLTGDCCCGFREACAAPLPHYVGFVSVYSRRDGIVNWRACLDPDAEQVEVRASHLGMGLNPGTYRAVADALADFRRREAQPADRVSPLSQAA
jgi:triacylglycerol lipase